MKALPRAAPGPAPMSEPRPEAPAPPLPPAPTAEEAAEAPEAPEAAALADVFGSNDDWGLRDLAMATFRNVMKGEEPGEV